MANHKLNELMANLPTLEELRRMEAEHLLSAAELRDLIHLQEKRQRSGLQPIRAAKAGSGRRPRLGVIS